MANIAKANAFRVIYDSIFTQPQMTAAFDPIIASGYRKICHALFDDCIGAPAIDAWPMTYGLYQKIVDFMNQVGRDCGLGEDELFTSANNTLGQSWMFYVTWISASIVRILEQPVETLTVVLTPEKRVNICNEIVEAINNGQIR